MRRHRRPSAAARWGRPVAAAVVACTLLAAVAGGLLRAGIAWPAQLDAQLAGQAAVAHAALMMSGFLGTVIGIERAVAVKLRWAWLVPLCAALGSALSLAGRSEAAALYVVASCVFAGVNIVVVRRQKEAHTALLLIGALAWFVGNLAFAAGARSDAVFAWWFAFLVVTIAAERLEMTRLMQRHPSAQLGLLVAVAALLLGALMSGLWPQAGGVLYGVALAALALWLGLFDIARRTALAHGLSRYMAVCLLAGYAWLGVAGAAWAAMALGAPSRDLALHALGLGFIVSMVMGHAPVILPAVARVKLHFGLWFYAPLALLHLSLVLRLGAGFADNGWRSTGASLNALAFLLFAASLAGSALAWRRLNARTSLSHRTP